MVETRESHLGEALLALSRPRATDEPEFSGKERRQAMAAMAKESDFIRSAWIGDALLAVYGAIRPTLLGDAAVLWLVGTPNLDAHPFAALRPAKRELARMRDEFGYDKIIAWVFHKNETSIKWLNWLGFQLTGQQNEYYLMEA